jgi:hypothetical protein
MLMFLHLFFIAILDDVNDFAPLVLDFLSRIFLIVFWTMLMILHLWCLLRARLFIALLSYRPLDDVSD